MRARRKAKLTLAAHLTDDQVVLLRLPDRHRLVKHVRHPQQQVIQLVLHGFGLCQL